MDRVSVVDNLIGSPSARHQTEELGPTRDHTKENIKTTTTPIKTHPVMDVVVGFRVRVMLRYQAQLVLSS